MVIWSESLDRIIPLCQEFEERLIKLLWRSRPLLNTPSASSAHYQAGVSGGSGNGSLVGYSGSASVEVLSPSTSGLNWNGNGNGSGDGNSKSNGNGNGATDGRHSDPPSLARTNGSSSLALNLLQHSSNSTSSSIRKGPYGEQGREFDELEMDEKDKDKLVSGFSGGHLNGLGHDQKSEDGRTNRSRGGYKRTWYGKKVFVQPSSTQEDDLEGCKGERRPVRLYAPVYNGLAAGIALGMLFSFSSGFLEETLTCRLDLIAFSVHR